jgi:NitT/TauT family transport system substrate-binding protein
MTPTMQNILRRALAGVAGLAFAASALAQAPEKLKVRLDWTPWGVHAAMHLAQQKGWYKAAGLDVELEDGNGSVTTVQIVGGGSDFDVGHAALGPMMIARDKGLPVKAIAVFARTSDLGMLAPVGSGIKGPKDLKGKKVAYTAGSLEAPFIDAFLAAGGLKRDDLELVNVDAAAKGATYVSGRADAVFSTIPFFEAAVAQARPSISVKFADYKLPMPSFGLFATEEKLASRREAIAKFASITAASWQYIYNGHEDEAVEAIVAQRPQAKLDKKVLRGQIESLRGFFHLPVAAGETLGAPVASDWSEAVKTLSQANLIKAGADAKNFYVPGLVRPTPAISAAK